MVRLGCGTCRGKQLSNFSNLDNIKDIRFSLDGRHITIVRVSNEIKLQVTDKATGKSDIQTFPLITYADSSAYQNKLLGWLVIVGIISGSLVALVLPVGYLIARWITQRSAKLPEFPTISEPDLGKNHTTAISKLSQGLTDEVQVAQAIQQGSHRDIDLPLSAFSQTSEYFPVTGRQMKQSWRYLRRLIREGPAIQLDVEATVQQISHQGMLLNPVLRPRRVNRNELLLLVDQDGSMVPFHALSERLAKTAMHGGKLAKADIYFFHNCPIQYLYRDPYHQEAEAIANLLSGLHSEHTGVLIFSDAGAARGAFNPERFELTAEFLGQLRQQFRYIAWLNPMPRRRWTGTAAEIAKLVPMFELSRQGLNQAINVLRGKSVHQTVSIL